MDSCVVNMIEMKSKYDRLVYMIKGILMND